MFELIIPYAIFWLYTVVGTVALLRGKIYFRKQWQLAGRPARWYGGMLLLLGLPTIFLVGPIVDRFAFLLWDVIPFSLPREIVYGIPQFIVFMAAMVGAVVPFRGMEERPSEATSATPAGRSAISRILAGVALGVAAFQQGIALHSLLTTAFGIRTLPGGGTSSMPPEAVVAVIGVLASASVGALLGVLRSTVFASPGRGRAMWLGACIGLLAGLGVAAGIAILKRDSSLLIGCLLGSLGSFLVGAILGGIMGSHSPATID
jgi:hypothetical protein